jgi:hypothetical protein
MFNRYDIKWLHAFRVKYIGPTGYRGARVSIQSLRFGDKIVIPYKHEYNSIADMAIIALEERGYNIVAEAESLDGYVILSDTFKPLKEE